MKSRSAVFVVIAGITPFGSAQQPAWGQCGGSGWTGQTSCASGYTCQAQNAYYSQCVPSTATSRSSWTTTSTSKPSSIAVRPSTALATSSLTKTISISTSISSSAVPRSTSIEYLISFGDSYSQTGFDPTLNLASQSNPLGNPAFPGWTTSGGPNWIGYYITQYNSSPVYSYNFASGGATTDAKLVAPFASTVLSFVDQVDLYLRHARTADFTQWNAANSVFAVWIGVNDVGNAWYLPTYATLLGQIMDQYINQTQALYNSGARRFLFLTVPPIQLSPSVQAGGTANVEAERAAVKQYNNALESKVAAFAAANPQAATYVVDTTAPFLKAIENPNVYGADNASCFDASGTECLWWNDYHPGLAIHKLLAEAVAEALRE